MYTIFTAKLGIYESVCHQCIRLFTQATRRGRLPNYHEWFCHEFTVTVKRPGVTEALL